MHVLLMRSFREYEKYESLRRTRFALLLLAEEAAIPYLRKIGEQINKHTNKQTNKHTNDTNVTNHRSITRSITREIDRNRAINRPIDRSINQNMLCYIIDTDVSSISIFLKFVFKIWARILRTLWIQHVQLRIRIRYE